MVDAAHMAHRTLGLAAVVALSGAGIVAAACGGGDSGVSNSKLPEGVRSQAIEHESCTEGGHKVEMLDVNNDGTLNNNDLQIQIQFADGLAGFTGANFVNTTNVAAFDATFAPAV